MTYIDKTDKSINDFVKLCGTKSTNNLMPLLHRLALERKYKHLFFFSINIFNDKMIDFIIIIFLLLLFWFSYVSCGL